MKITNLRLNYYILIFGLLFGVVFYDVIQFNLGFSYTDEILAVILFFYLLLNPKRITREFLFFLCLTIFYLAHSIYDQHNILPAIFTDFFIQVKPFIAFYAVYNLNFRISEKHEKKIAKLSLVCAFLLLPVGLLNPGGGTLMDQFGGYWWLPLPILQNTVLTVVNQLLANSCLVIQNQRGTKMGQNHGKIKSRTLRPKYPLWNTSVSFAKVQICPLKNEGKSLFLSFTTHFPTIVLQMWLLQAILTSNSMTCEYRVLNFVLHSVGHFQKRELAIEPKICHPYCSILGLVNV